MLRGSWSQVSNAEAAKRQEAGNRYLFDVADLDNANITHHAVDGLTMRKDSWVSSVQAATTYEAQNTMFVQIGATICLKYVRTRMCCAASRPNRAELGFAMRVATRRGPSSSTFASKSACRSGAAA